MKQPQAETKHGSPRVFNRVVCAVDESDGSLEAVRQAGAIAGEAAHVVLVHALDPLHEIWDAPPYKALETAAAINERAAAVLERARSVLGTRTHPDARVIEGKEVETLLELVDTGRHCLLAVAATGTRRRLTGVLTGALVTEVVRRAPCSVLIARPADPAAKFPRSIVVGIDGSDHSAAAFAAAVSLAEGAGAQLEPLVALGGKRIDLEAIRTMLRGRRFAEDERPAADALAGVDADLLVVGSRGLHGLAALGSVSERVAHASASSVLVIRPP